MSALETEVIHCRIFEHLDLKYGATLKLQAASEKLSEAGAKPGQQFSAQYMSKHPTAETKPGEAGRSRGEAGPANLSSVYVKTTACQSEAGRSRREAGVCTHGFLR